MSYNIWDKITAEQILYSRFIKYTSLRKIVEYEFAGSSATTINIYIDLFSFTRMLYRVHKYISAFSICSAIINYCGHLRTFFRNGYGVNTNIIMLYTSGSFSMNRKYYYKYSEYYQNIIGKNMAMAGLINNNIKLLDAITHYLPDIYLKITSCDINSVIKFMIDKKFFPDVPNFVISDAQNAYQLPVICKDTIVARKKRVYQEDVSYAYDSSNCLNWYIEEVAKGSNVTVPQMLNQYLITAATSIMGGEKLSIKPLCSIPKLINILLKITPGHEKDMEFIYNIISEELGKNKRSRIIPFEEFANRFCAVDVAFQSTLYGTLPEANMTNFKTKMRDPDTVKSLNSKYFSNCPIDLDKL